MNKSDTVLEVEDGLGNTVGVVIMGVDCRIENDSSLVKTGELDGVRLGVKMLMESVSSDDGKGISRMFELVDSLEKTVVGVGVIKRGADVVSMNIGTEEDIKKSSKEDDSIGVGSTEKSENVLERVCVWTDNMVRIGVDRIICVVLMKRSNTDVVVGSKKSDSVNESGTEMKDTDGLDTGGDTEDGICEIGVGMSRSDVTEEAVNVVISWGVLIKISINEVVTGSNISVSVGETLLIISTLVSGINILGDGVGTNVGRGISTSLETLNIGIKISVVLGNTKLEKLISETTKDVCVTDTDSEIKELASGNEDRTKVEIGFEEERISIVEGMLNCEGESVGVGDTTTWMNVEIDSMNSADETGPTDFETATERDELVCILDVVALIATMALDGGMNELR